MIINVLAWLLWAACDTDTDKYQTVTRDILIKAKQTPHQPDEY